MRDHETTGRLLLTIAEAAVALGIGRSLCYELVLKGELPSIKLGRARRVPIASLEAFVARKTAAASLDGAESSTE